MYEGATEYFSLLIQVENMIITEEEFIKEIRLKLNRASTFKSFSFTQMSEKILSKKYQKEYVNVYNKGALLAFFLDIEIAKSSNGEKRLIDVMKQLIDKYGADKSFNDDDLFDDIIELTSPEIKQFLDLYIKGYQILKYKQVFRSIGWEYKSTKVERVNYFGSFGIDYKDSNFIIADPKPNCSIAFQQDDIILAINNEALTQDNIDDLFESYFMVYKQESEIEVSIIRKGVKMVLKGKPIKGVLNIKNHIQKIEGMNSSQSKLNQLFFK